MLKSNVWRWFRQTRSAELCFFYDTSDQPLLARGKTFLEGWIPIVHYALQEGGINYDIEYLAIPARIAGLAWTLAANRSTVRLAAIHFPA